MFERICLLTMLLIFSGCLAASDLARERRMADEITDTIIDGEPVNLVADGHEFLNIYTEAEQETVRGSVIILHGRGFHPDWVDAVNPLRVGLAEAGWNTLSMQMPVLAKDAEFYDYVPILHEAFPRIEAGIDYLKQQGNDRIVLIAHSCSVHMSMAWIDAGRLRDIDAYVGIGMGAVDYQQPMAKPFPLDRLTVPVLDVFGGDEYPAVIKGAPQRLAAINRAGNAHSRQLIVPGANHYFTDRGDDLLQAVSDWLNGLETDR